MLNSWKNDVNASQQQQSTRTTSSLKASKASPVLPAQEATDNFISIAKIYELLQKLMDDRTKFLDDQAKPDDQAWLPGGGLNLGRAHWSRLPAKPGVPPRPFIMRFLRFQQEEWVRQLAREIGDVSWQSHKISFYHNFSKAMQEQAQTGWSIVLKIWRRLWNALKTFSWVRPCFEMHPHPH